MCCPKAPLSPPPALLQIGASYGLENLSDLAKRGSATAAAAAAAAAAMAAPAQQAMEPAPSSASGAAPEVGWRGGVAHPTGIAPTSVAGQRATLGGTAPPPPALAAHRYPSPQLHPSLLPSLPPNLLAGFCSSGQQGRAAGGAGRVHISQRARAQAAGGLPGFHPRAQPLWLPPAGARVGPVVSGRVAPALQPGGEALQPGAEALQPGGEGG